MIFSSILSPAQPRPSADASAFVIDDSRPYVYLLFDHSGKGVRSADGDSDSRFWFRLINNCQVPIKVRTSGVPKGRPVGEIGIIYEVVENRNRGVEITSTAISTGTDKPLPPQTNENRSLPIPIGNVANLSSAHAIPPKGSLLFSIPANHLSSKWHIEIPYTFATPPGKGPRAEEVGGEPIMVLLYEVWNLPNYARREPDTKR
jgi:hypothetical protein